MEESQELYLKNIASIISKNRERGGCAMRREKWRHVPINILLKYGTVQTRQADLRKR